MHSVTHRHVVSEYAHKRACIPRNMWKKTRENLVSLALLMYEVGRNVNKGGKVVCCVTTFTSSEP